MDMTEADLDRDLDCRDWCDGWDHGLDNIDETLARAVMRAEARARCYPEFDVGAFIRGRNAAIAAWHENEREMAAEAAGRE